VNAQKPQGTTQATLPGKASTKTAREPAPEAGTKDASKPATKATTKAAAKGASKPATKATTKAAAKASSKSAAKAARPAPARRDPSKSKKGSPPALDDPSLYLNRELTWLAFNGRVLAEASDARNPLLERLKFLAIATATLDEFVMKRIGGLKQQVAAGIHDRSVDGRTPREQMEACLAIMRDRSAAAVETLRKLRKLLEAEDVRIVRSEQLSGATRKALRERYVSEIFPLVTPQAMDPAHPFPFISNLSLNLLITLRHEDGDASQHLARVKVPVGAGIRRFMQVSDGPSFVPLEDVIADNLDLLFPGMEVLAVEAFRVTRNANTERDEEEADDLVALIETELRDRKFAPIVRLEIAPGMVPLHRGMLAAELGLDEERDVVEAQGMLCMGDLMQLASLDLPKLHDTPHHPVDAAPFTARRSVFHIIRDRGAVLVHQPYESFTTSVERFLSEASVDPKVRAIKATLYRTAEQSKVVEHLITAARNGKQVAVVVELKARFDEAANIRWATHLESVGIHVTYGVIGLKTHAKVILVVRQDFDGLRRYAHMGTGNYHSGTARLYGDLGVFTCDPDIGHDLTELFNYLTTGYKPRRDYRKLLPAPKHLKPGLLSRIAREATLAKAGKKALIQLKCNALEDADITRALYEASQAGVHVDLIVRDTCRLRPGLKGISENVRVISIVGRFLEHARIYYFRNDGDEEYLIGSADLMKRNLESRVETVFPVEGESLTQELRFILDTQLADTRSAWEMQSDGSYERVAESKGKSARGCQQLFIEHAEKRHKKATRLKRRGAKGGSH